MVWAIFRGWCVKIKEELVDICNIIRYNLAKLVNLAKSNGLDMKTKTIASTEAQNNFGRILNDVMQNNTRYIVKRRHVSQAIILSLADFEQLLTNQLEQEKMANIIRELTPVYSLGETISADDRNA